VTVANLPALTERRYIHGRNSRSPTVMPGVSREFDLSLTSLNAGLNHDLIMKALHCIAIVVLSVPLLQFAGEQPPSAAAGGDDFVVPKLYAKSFRDKRAPFFVVEKWITPAPDTKGKFVLIDFWATWCGPCRESIPEINRFYAKYGDRMAVIGVSDEAEEDVRKMTSPQIKYAVAIDTRLRMMRTLGITGIPHTILIDPKGIVRYEGMPQYLDDQILEHFLEKYK
jgi:cytochrome c biogenesis protein CcmG/thiol:disulfide interchange protein DsbE